MWIYGVPEIPVTAEDSYRESRKSKHDEDCYRLSSVLEMVRTATLTYLSAELLPVAGQR
jgi:hypothetical protein